MRLIRVQERVKSQVFRKVTADMRRSGTTLGPALQSRLSADLSPHNNGLYIYTGTLFRLLNNVRTTAIAIGPYHAMLSFSDL